MNDLATLTESVAVDRLINHPADCHVCHQFLERCKALPPITTSVCWPCSDVALRGALEAADAGIILPTNNQCSTFESKIYVLYGSDSVMASADTWVDHRCLRIRHCGLSRIAVSVRVDRNEQRKYSCQQR